MKKNPLGLAGIEFIEFSTNNPERLHRLFTGFGFSKMAQIPNKGIDLYQQLGIRLILNHEKGSFGDRFQNLHGPSISAMGWRFIDPEAAYQQALRQGAKPCLEGDYRLSNGLPLRAIYGIGDSLIYFVKEDQSIGFETLKNPMIVPDKGFVFIDHLTNNVYKGTMQTWASFYKDIFGFEEVRYFDIKGQKTGLTSYALKSPCGQFCIPINEANEAKSQINEYLEEYRGPGVQHLAFLTRDLISSLSQLEGTGIDTLDIAPNYYDKAFARVPQVKEDRNAIRKHNILIDGDDDGYLLQIFTKNLVGPIFIELIQRENHLSFGEGNFQALFDSIERDQMKRGVL